MSTQTRGFLFADLRGYTAYTERRGDEAARELLRRYRAMVRDVIARHDGAEIRTEGDSFYVVFDSVRAAVLAGLEIQAEAAAASGDTAGDPIRVGVGIHAGETTDDAEEGIVSSAVNIAARVCSVAEPGEVLVTDTVRALTRSATAVHFTPRGRRRLKGIAEPVTVFRATGQRTETTRLAGLRLGIAVASTGIVLAAVALSGLVNPFRAAAPDASAGASPSTNLAASAAPSPTASVTVGRFTDPGAFPNVAESALLDQLLTRVADRCERADPADTPVFQFTSDDGVSRSTVPLRTRAGLTCLVDGVRIEYWQGSGIGGPGAFPVGYATDLFYNAVRRLELTAGDCAEASRVHGPWQAGAHTGTMLCYSGPDGATIEWTFDEENIYAIARQRAGDAAELYRWWTQTGRLLSR